MKSLTKRRLSFLLVFAMICSVLLPFSNKSNAKEVEGDVIKKASVTDADGNPFKPGQKIGAWQPFRIYAEFELPDNVVKENDTTTMTLPVGFNTSSPDHFDIKDGDEVIAHAKMYNQNPAKIVLTYTKYAETHSGVKGKFYFNVSVNAETQTGSGELPVTLTVNGKIIPAGKVDYNPPHFVNSQFTKGGWMTNDKTEGKYDIRINQDNVILVKAKFEDTIQSEGVSFIEDSLEIWNGKWVNNVTSVALTGKKNVTKDFKDAGKIKFDGKKLTIDIGDYPESNEKRGFQILYKVKLNYDPVAGEEIKNKAKLTYGEDNYSQESTYKIRDAGGIGEGYVFKIKVQKTGKDNAPLAGAKFDVIRVRNKVKVGEIVTGQDGSGEIGKLLRDEYQLVETEAPKGYQKLKDPITVKPDDFGTTKVAIKNIKNEPEEKIKVSGEKTWDDANNQDGKRPEKITVILKKTVDGKTSEVTRKDVTPDTDGKWKYEFADLPLYEGGKPIEYSIDEAKVDGYDKVKTRTTNGPDYNLTNKHTPETVDVKGEKTWNDNNNQDGKRPEKITVKLIKKVGDKAPEVVETKEVREGADKKWTYEFKGLPRYEKGTEITYSIEEEAVAGYVGALSGYNLTNTHTPETVDISGEKTWDDANNQDGKRPDNIKVILNKTVDGVTSKVTDKVVTKGANDKWEYEFKNLPKYENGKLITYSIDEEEVPGYKKTIDGNNIKNSYTPGKTKVSGEKTWDDNDNQDGKRPEKITVILKKTVDGKTSEVTRKDVTPDTDGKWKYEFADLPLYEGGKPIEYSIDEAKVDGYDKVKTRTTNGPDYNLTNKHTPETVDVKGEKTWNDNNNQDGKRPEKITVKLIKKVGDKAPEVVETKEVREGADKKWTYEFKGLPRYEKGTEITYSIEEEAVAGYVGALSGYNLTNTHTPETVDISGEKTWDDANNQDGKRPDNIKVILNKTVDGVTSKVTDKVVTKGANDKWEYEFKNLPKYENGKEITYSIDEEKVEGYEKEITGYNLKNKYTPGKTSVKVTKAWEDKDNQDGKRPTSVTIKLFANGQPTNKTITLTKENGWKGSFDNLDEYKDGQKIDYSIEEEDIGNGYKGFITQTSGTEFNVINKREPEKTFVEGSKTWDDKENQDGKRPKEIKINLLKNGTKIATKTVTKADDWKWKFENLDKYEKGEVINYTITEEQVEGYTTVVTGHNVKNSYTPGKTSVQVTKAWEDKNNQDGVRPASVTIRLIADGVATDKTLTLTEANNWTGSFTDLDEYKDGTKIVYTVKEETVGNGYESKVTGSAKEGFTVTNTREPEKTFVEGSKTWEDANNQDGKRPKEIKINLLKNGKVLETKTVTEKDGWKWKFENLDKYEKGEVIKYTITEEQVEGYTTVVTGHNVKNSYTPGKTSVQVTKAWEDKNNQDGVRPASVTIRLIADGVATDKTVTLTKDNNWTGSFTDLDEYKDGTKIVYTVKEETVGNGYESKVTGSAKEGFTVTNTREPEKTFVEGSKTWEDANNQDGKRPTEITVNLLKNGTKVATKKVTEKDGWKWKFENLDKYENGELINYTIVEEKVEGYTTEVEGYNVKNKYTPGKTSVQVTKAWKDNNDQDKKRPDSVTIELLADGKETGKKVVLTKENNWTGSFTDLDEYKDGKKIEYTVKEKAVGNGYKSVITGNAKEGFVVTNVRTPKPRIPKTGAGSNSALYTVLLGLSGTALFSVFRRKRKEELK
ncbi:Cna B-type domain-containing protein [Parvimonas micra]|uniref:Cna B-type domain-containing protein n=1 Tax=Parvimonas micra TaxID=33033 RepID=A0AAX3K6B8_9FIRM|nr:Cna B-type domain-containing protein [Parvimonas micra]WBB30750.1 Cna B-type domain-containing protein [Parvimonas micra]